MNLFLRVDQKKKKNENDLKLKTILVEFPSIEYKFPEKRRKLVELNKFFIFLRTNWRSEKDRNSQSEKFCREIFGINSLSRKLDFSSYRTVLSCWWFWGYTGELKVWIPRKYVRIFCEEPLSWFDKSNFEDKEWICEKLRYKSKTILIKLLLQPSLAL